MKPSRLKLFFTKLFHWEFWPFELVYFPVIVYYFWLSLKARSFFFFSASNPSIETGGMLGESKYSILKNIPDSFKAFTLFFPKGSTYSFVLETLSSHQLQYPLIAKPDVGERGTGVEKIQSPQALEAYLQTNSNDLLIQEYIGFEIELGIFYYRFPNQEKGTVSSIVKKEFLHVLGDGHSTLGELIAAYPRAGFQFDRLNKTLHFDSVPEKGAKIVLEPIGNHCRGTTFLNANDLIDAELIEVMDSISKQIPGFFFGRYDLRCQSIEALKKGEHIKIMELNGAGAEPGHIYHPGYSIFKAWKELLFHWKILYNISALNHRAGIPYMSFAEARTNYKKFTVTKKTSMSIAQIFLHFGLGFITSFIGSIPLGSINAAVLRISIAQTFRAALLFIAGATIAEFAYCFMAIHFSGFLLSIPKLEFYIQLISIPVFLLLGWSYWVAKPKADSPKAPSSKKPFLQGLSLGLLNPLQIPFWLAYGTYFLTMGWIQQETTLLNLFILGAIAGSSFLLLLIAKFASIYSSKIRVSDKTINRVTAGILVALALYQAAKLLYHAVTA